MNLTKLSLAVGTVCLLAASPAFAQSAGTSATGTSNGQQGTPGQPAPSSGGGAMKSGDGMKAGGSMKSGDGMKAGGSMKAGDGMKAGDAAKPDDGMKKN